MEWNTTRAESDVTDQMQRPITSRTDIRLPGFLLVRILLWLLIFAAFPLSVTAARLSFNLEVRGCKTYAPGRSAEKVEVAPSVPLAERVLLRLEAAEQKEFDPWLRDDIRIAWITVLEASRGNSQPHIDATYRVLGIHPEKVWPAICARRAALLGSKPIPHKKKQPMAANRDGDAPQKTCAYGAAGNTSVSTPRVEACRFSTGSSCRTETKREARRIRTSEFGLNAAPPAGVAATAVQTIPPKKRSQSVQNLAQEKGIV